MISSNFDVCGRAEISAENSFRLIYRKVKAKLRTCLESWNGKMSKKIEAFDGNSHFKMKNLRCVHNRPTRRPSRIAREVKRKWEECGNLWWGWFAVCLSVCLWSFCCASFQAELCQTHALSADWAERRGCERQFYGWVKKWWMVKCQLQHRHALTDRQADRLTDRLWLW